MAITIHDPYLPNVPDPSKLSPEAHEEFLKLYQAYKLMYADLRTLANAAEIFPTDPAAVTVNGAGATVNGAQIYATL